MRGASEISPCLPLREPAALPPAMAGGVVAIGNFDGVHLGHRAVLRQALDIAASRSAPALVLTFEPHSRTFFRPQAPVFRLTPAAVKVRLLAAMGFGCVVEQRFDRAFAQMEAGDFLEDLLARTLGAIHVVAGRDFHFGRARQGTPAFLEAKGRELGMGVTQVEPLLDESGEPVSATRIRAALAAGEVAAANRMLGRPWSVEAEVVHGRKLGRTLGFPTANQALPPETKLRHGIYAVRARRRRGSLMQGVASFGRRPTFDDGPVLLETFLFDFDEELYGEELEIFFHAFLRPELKFAGPRELAEQMRDDALRARKALAAAPLHEAELS